MLAVHIEQGFYVVRQMLLPKQELCCLVVSVGHEAPQRIDALCLVELYLRADPEYTPF